MTTVDRPEVELCGMTGKERHATKAAIKAKRSNLLARKGKANGRTNVYRCDWCDGWHVGRR